MAVAQKGMQKSTKKLVDEEVIPVFCVPETCLRVGVQVAPLAHLELPGSP